MFQCELLLYGSMGGWRFSVTEAGNGQDSHTLLIKVESVVGERFK